MTATRRKSFRGWAYATALAVTLALALPIGSVAFASHSTDPSHTLEVTPETDSNPTGTTHTLTATVDQSSGPGTEIDFEIESGPAARVGVTGDQGQGGTVSDDGNSPTSPDMTCTVPAGQTTCTVTFTSDSAGTHVVRAWVDDDRDNTTVDADRTEGRDEGQPNQGGDRTEPDDTDVVEKSWFAEPPGNVVLDCEPEVATNPSTGEGSSEPYECQLWNNNNTQGNRSDDTRVNTAGVVIDAENLGGANDPDDSADQGPTGTADYNNVCTTDNQGRCTATIPASEQQAGDALICFWVDGDNDNAFNPGGDERDGGNCDETNEQTGAGDPNATSIGNPQSDRDDQTDVVRKTWRARGQAVNIDCEPESDQNVRGQSHTVNCTVTDFFGDPVQGAQVDFTVTGRNPQVTNNATTDAQGRATLTYTDNNTALTQEGQRDEITGCIDPDTTAGCPNPGNEAASDHDVVQKFWFTTIPTTAALVLDMEPDQDPNTRTCPDGATDNTAAANQVATTHEVCAVARNAQGNPIPGQEVTFTISGPGNFTDAGGSADRGQTFTVNADQNGVAQAFITSNETGTTTVTATSDGQSASGTKPWTTPAAGARVIDCEPEEDTNPPGSQHVIACTVTDRFGNPVPGVTVNATETGPGRFSNGTSSASAVTNANGVVEFVVQTTQNEEGDQTISAEIGAPARTAGPNNDPCEQPAGTTTAGEAGGAGTDRDPAPAGVCIDQVTKTWGVEETPTETPTETPDEVDPRIFRELCNPERDPEEQQRLNIAGGDGQIIVGTNGDDLIDGTNGDDLICGLDGHDSIKGFGGNDFIIGQRGQDNIGGGSGDDDIRGGTGHDTLRGGGGDDQLRGGHHNDDMAGGRGRDDLRGGRRHDTLNGGRGSDVMRASRGNDVLRDLGGRGNLFNAGPGSDVCIGRANRGNVYRRCNTLRQI